MCNFIEDYLQNPSLAIAALSSDNANRPKWHDTIDDELIYRQISSPEFRLYEEMI